MNRRYAVAALIIALALTGCAAQPVSQEPTPTTTPAVTAAPSDALAPSVTPSPTSQPEVPAEPVLTVTVTDAMPWAEAWEPPTMDGTYRVIDDAHGFPENGTKYVLAHARTPWRGSSPGNDWVEKVTASGQIVVLDGVRYVVGAISTVDKPRLVDAPIWGPTDSDRAYLITCVPLITGETATQNRIITLTREGAL
ncbi:hypothetical protein [Microbacterium binotii]|uniref:Sortase n=1 Tax=Microbacterium binotii TaxID=462710 RepID=A0ABN3P974_9MICO